MLRLILRLAGPAALVLSAVVVSACIAPAGAAVPNPTSNPTASPSPNLDPNAAVIRVDLEGGFVSPNALLGRLPVVLVAGDGRVITDGPTPAIWPGALMPNLRVRTLTPEALAGLLALAKDKALLADASYDLVGIADAATTVLRITLDGTTSTVSAYALGDEGTDASRDLPKADADGRAALRSFVDALTGLPDTSFSDQDHAYAPDALRLFASPYVPSPDVHAKPVAWPLEHLATAGAPAGAVDPGIRCQVVSGADLATVLPLLQHANQATPFRSGGSDWNLSVRPLLPGETGC